MFRGRHTRSRAISIARATCPTAVDPVLTRTYVRMLMIDNNSSRHSHRPPRGQTVSSWPNVLLVRVPPMEQAAELAARQIRRDVLGASAEEQPLTDLKPLLRAGRFSLRRTRLFGREGELQALLAPALATASVSRLTQSLRAVGGVFHLRCDERWTCNECAFGCATRSPIVSSMTVTTISLVVQSWTAWSKSATATASRALFCSQSTLWRASL